MTENNKNMVKIDYNLFLQNDTERSKLNSSDFMVVYSA